MLLFSKTFFFILHAAGKEEDFGDIRPFGFIQDMLVSSSNNSTVNILVCGPQKNKHPLN